MLGSDSRSAVDMGLLGDRRVRHFWDGERTIGRWLAESGVGNPGSGIIWDAYFVFGPDAVWNDTPAPLSAFGTPVISHTSTLERELAPLLN
jgi:hypothetical protein